MHDQDIDWCKQHLNAVTDIMTNLKFFLLIIEIIYCSEAIAKGFSSPDDFVIKTSTLKYTDGGSYQVRAMDLAPSNTL